MLRVLERGSQGSRGDVALRTLSTQSLSKACEGIDAPLAVIAINSMQPDMQLHKLRFLEVRSKIAADCLAAMEGPMMHSHHHQSPMPGASWPAGHFKLHLDKSQLRTAAGREHRRAGLTAPNQLCQSEPGDAWSACGPGQERAPGARTGNQWLLWRTVSAQAPLPTCLSHASPH